jgi:DNA-binding NarL/FixJ family response regulator
MTPPPSAGDGVRILLVDDHRVFAEALAALLEAEPGIDDVRVASSLDSARAMIVAAHPDLILLDLTLVDESGLDLLRDPTIAGHRPDVVILSGSNDPGRIIDALDAGAQGWLSKDTRVDALLDAVWQVLHGYMYLSPENLRPVLERLLANVHNRRSFGGFVDELTPRELEVLRCLVAGMTRAEVAQHLFVSTNTVRTHVQSLLRQSDQHSTLALVAMARALGVTGIDEDDKPSVRNGPGSSQ